MYILIIVIQLIPTLLRKRKKNNWIDSTKYIEHRFIA